MNTKKKKTPKRSKTPKKEDYRTKLLQAVEARSKQRADSMATVGRASWEKSKRLKII
jgi:hypothetical protein